MQRGSRERAREGLQAIWASLHVIYADFDRNDYLTHSAALAYYCLLSMFPLLVFLASLLAIVPVPNLFRDTLDIMARIVPHDAMGLVRGVLRDALETDPRLLSFSIAGAIFAASGAFNSLIATLNLAYNVREARPYWKRALIAVALTILTGLTATVLLMAVVIGPDLGTWLAIKLHLRSAFAECWPFIRWLLIGTCTVFSIETIYFLGPNVRLRFQDQVAGAAAAFLIWILASWGLGLYLSRVTNYQHLFGTLGAAVGLMLWLYLTSLSLVVGAEINSQLLRVRGNSPIDRERMSPES